MSDEKNDRGSKRIALDETKVLRLAGGHEGANERMIGLGPKDSPAK